MKKKKKKSIKTLDLILAVLASFLFIFIAIMCWFYYKFQSIPDTLVTAVLSGGSVELIVTALIQITKVKHGIKDNDDE